MVIQGRQGIFTTGQRIDEAAWWFELMDRCYHTHLLTDTADNPTHWRTDAAREVVSDPDLFD